MALDIVQKLIRRGGPGAGDERRAEGNQLDQALIAQGLPAYTEMARRFGGISAMNTSALAALVIRPSTVANCTLFNNEPEGGLSYVMDRAFAFNLVTTTALAFSGLWLCVHPKGLSSPTNDITARGSQVGKKLPGGNSVVDTAMTVTNDGWFPWGPESAVEATGALPGGVLEAKLEGRIIVPPQCGISTQVVSGVTGNTFTSGFAWHEVPLSLD